jgi:protein TonB
MRLELVLGGLASVVFHCLAFLLPWAPMPRPHVNLTPRPELEISLPVPGPVKGDPRMEPPRVQPPASERELEHVPSVQPTVEPQAVPKKNPANLPRAPSPQAKKRSGLEKAPAVAQPSSAEREVAPGLRAVEEPVTGSVVDHPGENVGESALAKGELTGGPQAVSAASGLARAELKRALPRYGSNPKPPYPEAARKRGYEGEVILSVLVLKDGSPGRVRVARSSGYSLLDNAARDAVAQWKFVPARAGEEPVEMEVEVPILFRLE